MDSWIIGIRIKYMHARYLKRARDHVCVNNAQLLTHAVIFDILFHYSAPQLQCRVPSCTNLLSPELHWLWAWSAVAWGAPGRTYPYGSTSARAPGTGDRPWDQTGSHPASAKDTISSIRDQNQGGGSTQEVWGLQRISYRPSGIKIRERRINAGGVGITNDIVSSIGDQNQGGGSTQEVWGLPWPSRGTIKGDQSSRRCTITFRWQGVHEITVWACVGSPFIGPCIAQCCLHVYLVSTKSHLVSLFIVLGNQLDKLCGSKGEDAIYKVRGTPCLGEDCIPVVNWGSNNIL